jgi:hypothetical protein
MRWLIFVSIFIGMMGFVSAVTWQGSSINYNITEDIDYYHNLSANITGFNDDILFSIDTAVDNKINWTYPNGSSSLVSPSSVSDWISITDSSTGNMTINVTHNNQTGFFIIPIQAVNTSDEGEGAITNFEFNISLVNDAPNFTNLNAYHSWLEDGENVSIYINASDEEGEYDGGGYPLNFSINITSCNYSLSSSRSDNVDCNDLFAWEQEGNKSVALNITRTNDFVGVYNITFQVNDSNSQTEFNTTFEVNNSNDAPNITFACDDNRSIIEDDYLNCWVNATDADEVSSLTFTIISNLTYFVFNDSSKSYLFDCSGAGGQCNASANISFLANDSHVGNWSVNISVTDTSGGADNTDWSNFSFSVNNVEDVVNIDQVSDIVAYENRNFTVTSYDNDFFVTDVSVKDEEHTFSSNNTNLVYFDDSTPEKVGGTNYTNATASINFTYAELNAITNASINISVIDGSGNSNYTTLTINFSTNNAPNWSAGDVADYDTNYSIAEDASWSGLNLSEFVNDSDPGDSITFYFVNSSAFCSLNSTNFNATTGIINFTPTDCDVGDHLIEIIATDTKVNSSKNFNFTITNINDTPILSSFEVGGDSVSDGGTKEWAEDTLLNFSLRADDHDFLIPESQRGYYNESLTVGVNVTNSSNSSQSFSFLNDSSFYLYSGPGDDGSNFYRANFTPVELDVGNYTVVINVTDNSVSSAIITLYLNITQNSDPPILASISNQTLTVHDILDLTVSASDDEDDLNESVNLSYFIVNLTSGPALTIGEDNGSIYFDMDSTESYAGTSEYNISVNDSDGNEDWQQVQVVIYGIPSFDYPSSEFLFNLTENVSFDLNFSSNHSVGDNLTYSFWIDSIDCNGTNVSSNCSYGDIGLRESISNIGNGSNFSWSFVPNYSDESYGLVKNLTVSVSSNNSLLNSTQKTSIQINRTFKLNISHANSPVGFSGEIVDKTGYSYTSGFDLNLSSYFSDVDFSDAYYENDSVNFSFNSGSSPSDVKVNGNRLPVNLTLSDWDVTFTGVGPLSDETVWIDAIDFNETNVSMSNATSNNFTVSFSAPDTVTTVVSGGGGGTTKLKHFSLKLIVPQDIVISDANYIDIPFTVQNNGQMDLMGVGLSSFVSFNDVFSDDVKISLGDNYIPELRFGEAENFTMRILANTQKSGRYRATIFANVTSPKFSDYGDFFVDLRKTNESEAEQILVFTEKFVADNPECLELTESLKEAEVAYYSGDFSASMRIAQEVTEACEDTIEANDQIKYPVTGFVQENFYYISFATLTIFLLGFVFYVYKRVRFNKSKMDEYV